MFDERGCDVQHDRYVVARKYSRDIVREVSSAVVERYDDRVTFRHCIAFEHLGGTIQRRGAALVGKQGHLLLETPEGGRARPVPAVPPGGTGAARHRA